VSSELKKGRKTVIVIIDNTLKKRGPWFQIQYPKLMKKSRKGQYEGANRAVASFKGRAWN
jgi:hypothetical protein